ncbi:hypothetical protein [Streptomyces sp. NPDC102283]|uniref:hypothetical protein n=1 Tax=Streptomyces sp. NPDC102283 TaxID=3366155 RepID=UPI00381295C1
MVGNEKSTGRGRAGKVRAGLFTGVLVVGAMAAGAPTAQAEPPNGSPCLAITGATACFETSGDDFHVKDTDTDGASARANWYVNYDRDTPHCTNSKGAGTWHECKFDMKETYTVCWRPEVYNASTGTLVRVGTYGCTEI